MLMLLAGCGGAGGGVARSTAADRPVIHLLEITDHVLQLHAEGGPQVGSGSGSDYYSTMVLTDAGAVVIDPTSDAVAARWVAELRRRRAALHAIVYSHWHIDHSSGSDTLREAFGSAVPIIAHERALRAQQAWNREHPGAVRLPTETVGDEGRVLELGGVGIRLAYMGHAHSDNMLVVTITPDRVAYACDFVQNRGVAYRDLPGIDIVEQIAMLYRVAELDVDRVLFCHTPPGDLESVRLYARYFEELWDGVAAAIARGLSEDQTAAEVTMDAYRGWARADRWLTTNVRGMHRWLTAHPHAERPTGPTPIPSRQ